MKNFKIKILFVEDEADIREQLSFALKRVCGELITACDGEEGLELFKKHKPDIVISDIQMPKMDGLKMVEEIKKIDPSQFIIFTTAFNQSDFLMKAIELQVDGYTLKPINVKNLLDKVKKLEANIQAKKTVKYQEVKLFEQSKMASMGEMMGNIAHQWRQPLMEINAIHLDLESRIKFEDQITNDELLKTIDKSNEIVDYMSATINNFMNFFRQDSEKELFKISDIIEAALEIVKLTVESDGILLSTDLKSCCKCYINKNELSQVILNIVQNAKEILLIRKIEDPKIDIKIHENDQSCFIEVKDNGGGITIEPKEKIFELMFTREKPNGLGLGLYTSKIIVENHLSGNLTVKNYTSTDQEDNEECGAIFTIELKKG